MSITKLQHIKNLINYQELQLSNYKARIHKNREHFLYKLQKKFPFLYIYEDEMKKNNQHLVYDLCILIHCQLFINKVQKINVKSLLLFEFVNVFFFDFSKIGATQKKMQIREFIKNGVITKGFNSYFYCKNFFEILKIQILKEKTFKKVILVPCFFDYKQKNGKFVHCWSLANCWIFIEFISDKKQFKLQLLCNELCYQNFKKNYVIKTIFHWWFCLSITIEKYLKFFNFVVNDKEDYVKFCIIFFFLFFIFVILFISIVFVCIKPKINIMLSKKILMNKS